MVLRLPFLLFRFGTIYKLARFSLTITMFMVPAQCLLFKNGTTFRAHLPTQSINHFYRLYIKCLDKLQEFPTPKKEVHNSVRTQSFWARTHTFARPQSFILCTWGHLEPPSVFSSNWKWRHTSWTHFWRLSNHSQPPRELWNGATVHDQRCRFRWSIFSAFVVSCDLLNNKNSSY